MVVKKRNNKLTVENLANELADKPYDQKQDNIVRITISLPESILYTIEDMAISNKRNRRELRSISAIIRKSIKYYLNIKLNTNKN